MDPINQILYQAKTAYRNRELKEAISILGRGIIKEPFNKEILHLFGIVLFETGDLSQALNYLRKAYEKFDGDIKILYNYASVLLEAGQFTNALKIYNQLLTIEPKNIQTLNKCCFILGKMGQLTLSEKTCRLILSIDNTNYSAYNNLGNILKDQGEIDGALSCYRKSISINNNFMTAHSNLLLTLNYKIFDQNVVYKEHIKWEDDLIKLEFSENITNKESNTKNKIRIGYISEDFRIHSVGYFIEPIIENHNKDNFEIYCYSDVACPDETTNRIKSFSSKWRSIYNKNDAAVYEIIKNDNIDILVDLAGHSGNNRLSLFAMKPAPVQVSFLGYPNTTGMSCIDYRFTDILADPVGQDQYFTEKLLRLDKSFLCYKPPQTIPAILNSPCIKNNYVSFGSFNNISKITDDVIKVWANILLKVPHSRLIIKSKAFNDKIILDSYKSRFILAGVEIGSLNFKGHSMSLYEHLNEYNAVDIALDTFPYNGTTTTCEALLMGVPVISLVGDRHAGRVGYSILKNCSFENMIALNCDEYVSSAMALSKNYVLLNEFRHEVRKRFVLSLICSSDKYLKSLEKIYNKIIE